MKRILFFIVVAMFATVTFAQHRHRQHPPRQFNPEEMAQRQTERLHQALQLDSVQLQAVFLINYADALTMQDSINARRERAEKMRAEGKKPERVQPSQEQMKQILTAEQFEKYLKYQEEQRNRMRQGRGGRPGVRPGGAPRGEEVQ